MIVCLPPSATSNPIWINREQQDRNCASKNYCNDWCTVRVRVRVYMMYGWIGWALKLYLLSDGNSLLDKYNLEFQIYWKRSLESPSFCLSSIHATAGPSVICWSKNDQKKRKKKVNARIRSLSTASYFTTLHNINQTTLNQLTGQGLCQGTFFSSHFCSI